MNARRIESNYQGCRGRSGRQWLVALLLVIGLVGALRARAEGCFPAPSGLVGWWAGDGNANDIAATNNGSLQGGSTASAPGMVGLGFTFDGTNGYVQIPDAPALKPTNLTVEAWVRFSSLDSAGNANAGQQYIVFKQNSRSSSLGMFEGFDLGKWRSNGQDLFAFRVSSSSGAAAEVLSTTMVTTGVWYHVAGVRGTNFLQLYVNGQFQRQTNVSFVQDYGTKPVFFGSSGDSGWDRKFSGTLDEVSLYNRALSSSEVAAVYAAGAGGKCKGASITVQPQSQAVVVGTNALFTVAATGFGLLSYQWQFNGATVAGATGTSLTLTNVQTTNGGSYTVIVTNSLGSVTSAVAVLTVWVPPAITQHPQSHTNVWGTDASFSVSASGTPPPGYQWHFNGLAITGATATTLAVSNVQFQSAGSYSVVASNVAGSVTSAMATLVVVCPSVMLNPTLPGGTAGTAYDQSLSASGGGAPYNYSVLGGSLPPGLVLSGGGLLSGTPTSVGSFNFTVRAADTNGCAGTSDYTIAVACPAITVNPATLPSSLIGSAYNQNLSANGGFGPYGFSVIAGALPAGLSLSSAGGITGTPAALGTNSFTVTAADTNGCTGNTAYTLVVTGAPPAISVQPQSRTNVWGTDASFSVSASGVPSPGYQWQFNGLAITGATATTLVLSNVQFSSTGTYGAVASNVAGSVTSAVAALVVVCPLVNLNPTVPGGTLGTAYDQSLSASGGAAPYNYSVSDGSLPPGLGLSGSGLLSGTPTSPGSFSFTVTAADTNGCTGNIAYSLVVTGAPPIITLQPQSRTNVAGTTATFSVSASGAPPPDYQWNKNGINIAGATATTLILSNVSQADAGTYMASISNVAGAVTSVPATLTVIDPPVITTQPVSRTNSAGTTATFTVIASGTEPSYQWFKNGTNALSNKQGLSGADTPILTISDVLAADQGDYSVVITNSAGAVTSLVATLTVNVPAGGDAVVLVNSESARYADFQHFVQPYLDNFGFPYTVQDIATNAPTLSIGNYGVIIIGHSQLDTNQTYLSSAAQADLALAVSNGTGLVNFDNELYSGSAPRYQFVQEIFGFSYGSGASGSSVSLPPTEPSSQMHYITARHPTNDVIGFRAGINVPGITVPTTATALAWVGGQPLVVVTKHGQGRAVQWGSYDWMVSTVLGPVDGLDDVVWRGVVWAARKPFVMRGLPPLVTMRVDDVSGPFGWVHAANAVGFKPFVSLFYLLVSESSAADLRALTTSGKATASIHSTDTGNSFFYFNHAAEEPWADNVQAENFYLGTQWHSSHGIPISKICATHYSEIGLNCFAGLKAWGIEYVPIEVVPETIEYATPGAPWLVGGPYRLYETPQPGQVKWPTYYADWLTVPGHPEFDGQFFDVYSEVRDVTGCGEWCPDNNNVSGSIAQATQMAKRTLDSMVMTTIFSHEAHISPISAANWQAMLQGITNNLASYNPSYVTLDYASQYVRAMRTSRLMSSAYDPGSARVMVTFSGKADLDTVVYIFDGEDSSITSTFAAVPAFPESFPNPVPVTGPPAVLNAPASRTNNAGTAAVFNVGASGAWPLSYRWYHNITNAMSDGGQVSGAGSATLMISNVMGGNAGSFTVVITNATGSATCAPAVLTVVDPFIASQPVSQTNNVGTTAMFSVGAAGTDLTYQWLKNGTPINEATNTMLSFTDVSYSDAGSYSVAVNGLYGGIISSNAVLAVYGVPTANNDSFSVMAGTTLTVAAPGVLENDAVGGGEGLTAMLVSGPIHGTLSLNADGGFIYVPLTNYVGTDSFTYQAVNGLTNWGVATVTISVKLHGTWLSDEFTRLAEPGPLSPWVAQSGNWAVTGGVLRGGTNTSQSYGYTYVGSSYTNYSVEGRLEFSTTNAWGGGIGGRLNLATGARYGAWVYPEGSAGGPNVLRLLKFQNWTSFGYDGASGAPMAEVDLTGVGTIWHSVKLAFHRNQIAVYYDGNRLISVADGEDEPYLNGGVSAEMWTGLAGYAMSVDEILVQCLAVDDAYSGLQNATLTVPEPGVLGNDTGVYTTNLVSELVSGPTNGTLNLSSNGGFNYRPAVNYCGTDGFSYRASQEGTCLGTAHVTITIAENRVPVILGALSNLTNDVVVIVWSSFVGETYRLQYKDSLSSTNWQDLLPNVTATGLTTAATNAMGGSNQRFYRVIVGP